jgi:23S rRNA pseudouridine2604 synthase
MNVDLGYLQSGDWRELTEEEMKDINKMIATSSKTEEASIEEKPKQARPKRNKAPTKNDFNKKSASFRKSSPKSKRSNTSFSAKKKRW